MLNKVSSMTPELPHVARQTAHNSPPIPRTRSNLLPRGAPVADFDEEVAGRVQRNAARPQPAGLLHAHAQPQRPPGVRPVQRARAAGRQVTLLRMGQRRDSCGVCRVCGVGYV